MLLLKIAQRRGIVMNNGSLKNKHKELKKFLMENIHPDVIANELARMEVEIPINANPELVAEQLSNEIIARLS